MARLVFVRHGKPRLDRESPESQWPLSDEGRRAAADLAARLNGFVFGSAVSSPFTFAKQTAELILAAGGPMLQVDERLRQHSRASIGALTRAELDAGVGRLFACADQLVFGDETADALFERVQAAVCDAREGAPGEDVLIVTHGSAMAIYLGRTLDLDPVALWRELPTPAAVVVEGKRHTVISSRKDP